MMEYLQSLFGMKINQEFQAFKKEQMKCTPEEIFNNAFQIDCYISLYEELLEMGQQFSENTLMNLLTFPELLTFLYERWMKVEDSSHEELTAYIKREVAEIHRKNFKRKGERKA